MFRTVRKPLSDASILNITRDTLQNGASDKAYFIKNWTDLVGADASDVMFTHHPEAIIAHRDQLSDFVSSRLKLHYNDAVRPDVRDYMERKKAQFRQKIESDKQQVARFVHHRNDRTKRPHYQVAEFFGFNVQTTDGKKLDMLVSSVGSAIRANIHIQRQVRALFVQYNSDAYIQGRMSGDVPQDLPQSHHRISSPYLSGDC